MSFLFSVNFITKKGNTKKTNTACCANTIFLIKPKMIKINKLINIIILACSLNVAWINFQNPLKKRIHSVIPNRPFSAK